MQSETFGREKSLYRADHESEHPPPPARAHSPLGFVNGDIYAGGAAKPARPAAGTTVAKPSDVAVQRVRDAGGPVDKASYSCECGYVFLAPVSTTVRCPHCDAGQAW